MVTKRPRTATKPAAEKAPKPAPKKYLFIREWVEHRQLSVDQVAAAIGIERESMYRWIKHENVNVKKVAQLAAVLGVEPEELWRPPSLRSLDAIAKKLTGPLRDTAVDVVIRIAKDAQ